jgi:hypothetical protein
MNVDLLIANGVSKKDTNPFEATGSVSCRYAWTREDMEEGRTTCEGAFFLWRIFASDGFGSGYGKACNIRCGSLSIERFDGIMKRGTQLRPTMNYHPIFTTTLNELLY